MEFDRSTHRLGLRVLEGGHLSNGFTKYTTYFKLTSKDGCKTLVDVAVECESASEAAAEEGDLKAKTTRFPLLFFECLESYLNKAEAEA